jgi:hypothetical protein
MALIDEKEVNDFIAMEPSAKLLKVLVAAGAFIIMIIGYMLSRQKKGEETDPDE